MNRYNLKIISIDYVPTNCKNPKTADLCLKCGKCGRKFKNGVLIAHEGNKNYRVYLQEEK